MLVDGVDPHGKQQLRDSTTLGLGGAIEDWRQVSELQEIRQAFHDAKTQKLPLFILGGGSNLLASDRGFRGIVLSLQLKGISLSPQSAESSSLAHLKSASPEANHSTAKRDEVVACAGESWDDLVSWSIAEGYSGLECLSGIPGTVGAAPIQNIGAYGVELSQYLSWVEVYDSEQDELLRFDNKECLFAYRDSRFKQELGRFVILRIALLLDKSPPKLPRYSDLNKLQLEQPTALQIRNAVLEVRRSKSMLGRQLLDPSDPNGRNAGSFFTNPILPSEKVEQLVAQYPNLPRFAGPPGYEKIAAAWLIQEAGFPAGTRRETVGTSTKHSLCLVCYDGANAQQLIAYAAEIVAAVQEKFAVHLEMEPRLIGFDPSEIPNILLS